MKNSIFLYQDYRQYLLDVIADRDAGSRGFRSKLATHLGCQRTFVSQVLSGDSDFNLEHADSFCRLVGLSEDEADFFLTLVSLARAGTESLKARLKKKLKSLREGSTVLKNRFIEDSELSAEDINQYYSSWLYGAIRMLVTIPQYQSRLAVEKYFQLPVEQIRSATNFLVERNLIVEKGSKLTCSVKHMYLGNDSKLVVRHHTNWRLQAINHIGFEAPTNLHFSSVNSLSREDVQIVRERLVEALSEVRERIKASPEECVYAVTMDFFEVK